ncbi:MAG: hypothetical protein BWX99_01749 [Deltaproteobacteria bacterium ADurb.Bin151]|nr:MAG: hypothetical protein BWX99_01749 [Deltaproteobacteria bacterium ADurb.Bin151]
MAERLHQFKIGCLLERCAGTAFYNKPQGRIGLGQPEGVGRPEHLVEQQIESRRGQIDILFHNGADDSFQVR